MNLFEMHEGMLIVSPEILGLKVFKKIYDRDKSKAKTKAFEELSYVYFFADFKSDFSDIVDEEERKQSIIEAVITDQKWEPDGLIEEAIDLYLERSNTVTSAMLDDAKSAVKKISKFLRNIDLNERDDKGKLVHNASQIAKTVGDMSNIVENVSALEQKVKKELEEESNMAGGHKKSLFEDGI